MPMYPHGIVGAGMNSSYLTSPMQVMTSHGSTANFNKNHFHHPQTFHQNQSHPYSLQPTHQIANHLPPNFGFQEMINLKNHQMNAQTYQNPMFNSRINSPENFTVHHSFDNKQSNPNVYENQLTSYQLQQQFQQEQMHLSQQMLNDAYMSFGQAPKPQPQNMSNTAQTKARKIVSETNSQPSSVTSSYFNEQTSTLATIPKTNRLTRSSNRTTRPAQKSTVATEQKSTRRKASRYK